MTTRAQEKHLVITANGNFDKAIASPQLSFVKKEMGEEYVLAFIARAINEACKLTNTSMLPEVQVMIASSILSDHWTLRIEEILNAINNGCKKKYGDINFKGIDYPTVMQWMSSYEEERSALLENRHMDTKARSNFASTARVSQPTQFDGIFRSFEAIRESSRGKLTEGEIQKAYDDIYNEAKNSEEQ